MKRLFFLVALTLTAGSFAAETAPRTVAEPFAFADFSWLTGNNRQKTSILDGKYFTGSFLADVNYIYSFNRPADHTIDGGCENGRHAEFQVQQLGIGGDFHHANVRGRLMTQFGMYATMTPRNDASPLRGQWDLANAYRYVSEAYGGYHFDVWNGINLDAGIFMSYVGLFSYYNFENWAYQPSYVSANTPWFFNGLRLQMFPTDRFKAELWLINGWQSYGMYNEMPGVGYQLAYRPNGRIAWVFNGYTGNDTLLNPGRWRFHSDNSVQIKWHENPAGTLSKVASSLTLDFGCETGGGVTCLGATGAPAQFFAGFMTYHRFWFEKDFYAVTFGAGAINNPGRYLVLIPPINGETAVTAAKNSPYFSLNAGDEYTAWDTSITFDILPSDFITFRFEFIHRESSQPYFVGSNGITPPNGNTGDPTQVVPGWGGPDLAKFENRLNLAMLVRF